MSDARITLSSLRHPDYFSMLSDWIKWRLTYEGGANFIDEYLQKFSTREDATDFATRRNITYCPAFAKAAVNDIKNSIFQRMADVVRIGGPESYQEALLGTNLGVDLRHSTMTSFIGLQIISELLTMSKVGVYVDMPDDIGSTILDKKKKHPYLYSYATEDILDWSFHYPEYPGEFSSILLCDHIFDMDQQYSLPVGKIERYRHVYLDQGKVAIQFYDKDNKKIDKDGQARSEPYVLNITRIPFVVFDIPTSLLKDVAGYQIALLNLESADINYAQRANFPFYTEQRDPRLQGAYYKQPGDTEVTDANASHTPERKVGVSQGRFYSKDMERPGFIHPSSEPLRVSMEKGEQLKRDIRKLVNLAVETIGKTTQSAASKTLDNQGLESGLSYIGLILEYGERKIADYWAMYEGETEAATISYPRNYSLRSEESRQKEAEGLDKLSSKVASDSFKREMAKQIVHVMLAGKVPDVMLSKIYDEVDAAPTMNSDPRTILMDLDKGLVTTETASIARGYKEGEAEKAKIQHAEKLALIAKSQTTGLGQARGIPDMQGDQQKSIDEKKDTKKRGQSKNPNVQNPDATSLEDEK